MAREIFGANLKMMYKIPENGCSFYELDKIVRGYEKNNVTSNNQHEVILFAPFTHLDHLSDLLSRLTIKLSLGAQGVSEYESGAHTSEISPLWLKELNVTNVLIGHSEVRKKYEELTSGAGQEKINGLFNRQILNALKKGLRVIYCIGETEDERNSGVTEEVIKRQIAQGLASLIPMYFKDIIIAYEPRWAIGGNRPIPKPQQIESIHRRILGWMLHQGHPNIEDLAILYGGSINSDNTKEIMSLKNVNGGLIGSACLDPVKFRNIVNYKAD